MRHGRAYRRLNRTKEHRRALLRNMATSLLKVGRIKTTIEKAKSLRPVVEKLITLGKRNTLHARRQAYSYFPDKEAVFHLFENVSPMFKARAGGYTRIVRTGFRHGDAAEMAWIELVRDENSAAESKTVKEKTSKSAASKSKAEGSSPKKSAAKKTTTKKETKAAA